MLNIVNMYTRLLNLRSVIEEERRNKRQKNGLQGEGDGLVEARERGAEAGE